MFFYEFEKPLSDVKIINGGHLEFKMADRNSTFIKGRQLYSETRDNENFSAHVKDIKARVV